MIPAMLTDEELFGTSLAIPENQKDILVRNTRILIGDVRASLKTLPEKSVHCIVTSPPYWGLRDYKTEHQVWGGSPNCKHEWIEKVSKGVKGNGRDSDTSTLTGGKSKEGITTEGATCATCATCGAWRGELGNEPTVEGYVRNIVEVFRELKRVLRDDAVAWLNIGDSYFSNGNGLKATGGLKPKDLCGVPWRLAFALQDDGWYLRSDVIWAKTATIPESVEDRPIKSHEYIFMLSKNEQYYYDRVAVLEKSIRRDGHVQQHHKYADSTERLHRTKVGLKELSANPLDQRNLRSVWRMSVSSYRGAHFAPYPVKLVETCIKAGTSEHGVCPKCGAQWERIVEKQRIATREGQSSKYNGLNESNPHSDHAGIVGNNDPMRHVTTLKTTGWKPACQCGIEKRIPATVLDPFLGSGTTAVTAEWLKRQAIGCELNRKFVGLAKDRIELGYRPNVEKEDGVEVDESLVLF